MVERWQEVKQKEMQQRYPARLRPELWLLSALTPKHTQITNRTSRTIIAFHLPAAFAGDQYPSGWLEVSYEAAALLDPLGYLRQC